MIAPLVGAVKNRAWLPECLGVSRGAALTIVFRPRSPGFEGKRSSLPSAHRDSIAMLWPSRRRCTARWTWRTGLKGSSERSKRSRATPY